MNDIQERLIDELLKTLTYDDMTENQMNLVVEYETEKYKKRIDELRNNMSPEEIKEVIHDWWLDYEISDKTEDNLLAYVNTK